MLKCLERVKSKKVQMLPTCIQLIFGQIAHTLKVVLIVSLVKGKDRADKKNKNNNNKKKTII